VVSVPSDSSSRVGRLLAVVLYALAGAVLTGVLGAAITAGIWALQGPVVNVRLLRWAALHGVLIGAAGLFTGALAGAAAIALAVRLARWRAASLGAFAGALVGGAVALTIADEPSSGPVAVAAIVSHALVGGGLALVARARAVRTRPGL
jgi:hypothetical protein